MFGKHPRGLMILFFTEMWERFGFYTLNAIFWLYMTREFNWDQSFMFTVYGVFLGLCYLFPIVGGWLGDHTFGPKRTIILGASLMVIGYAAFAASSAAHVWLFFAGVAFVSIGTGVFKTNISVFVGNLYTRNDPLKDAGYNIYYMGINLGATLSPLVATAISIRYDSYNISFAAAGVGMAFSILIFLAGRKNLAVHSSVRQEEQEAASPEAANSSENRQRVVTLFVLFAIVTFFWLVFYQNGSALTFFADHSTVPYYYLRPETYQFFNPFFILVLTPILVWIFGALRKKGKEPSSPTKIFWGMAASGFSMLVMVFASVLGGNSDTPVMSPSWLIGSYLIISIAEILVSPMGLSYVSKVAPRRLQGQMMGFWFVATSIGSAGAGFVGALLFERLRHDHYYLVLTVLALLSSALVIVFKKKLTRFAS